MWFSYNILGVVKGMKTKDFYYDLPERFIAQDPLKKREMSKLMVLDKKTGDIEHKVFRDIIDYLQEGDCLVLNDTRVLPARLYGNRVGSGGHVEILLLKRIDKDVWECLVKPGKKARKGYEISFGDGLLHGEIIDVIEDGNRLIKFTYEGIFEEILEQIGTMPLPPYITHKLEDQNRYQTVYAANNGSAAAPTAGLHFTEELLEKIKEKNIKIAKVTLHVGLGTFRPVKVDDVTNHKMHSEYFEVSEEAARIINSTKENGSRVICVGTTSCRTIESASNDEGKVIPMKDNTEIFIYPGYKFKVLDALITNFHLPESTLLMLVSALASKEIIMNAYEQAKENDYRFFSFGDAMLIIDK